LKLTLKVYYEEPQHHTITANKSALLPGETATLTVKDSDGNLVDITNWTIPDGYGSIAGSGGKYTYTAGGSFGDVDIVGTDSNGIKGKCRLNIKTITANSPIKLRPDGTAKITLIGNGDAKIEYRVDKSEIASVDGNGNVSPKTIGETTFTIICNDVATDCTGQIMVVEDLTITSESNGVMGMTKPINLKIESNLRNSVKLLLLQLKALIILQLSIR